MLGVCPKKVGTVSINMERLKQTAQQNVVHAKALHEDLPRKIESVKKLVSEEKYEDADEEMRKWRRQTEMLQEQIDNQLKHCKDLRESKTLLSLYTEDAGILVGRRAREICSILKNDVLSLNFHFPKLAYNEGPSAKEEYEGKHSYDGEDGDEAKKMFEARRQSEGPSRDEIVHKEILELFQRFELSPGSVEKSESASDGADYEDTMSMKELSKQLEAIFELFFLRSRMITNVVFDTTQQKKRMDKEFGYIEDFRKIEQRNFNESDEVFQLNKLIKNSREMTTEIKSSRMSMAADAGETMHRLTTENKELLSKVEEALDRRDRAEQRLEEYLSENPLSTVDRIKMEEAISKMTEFRTKLQKQNDKNAEHAVETERLKDQLTVLNDKVIHLQEALRAQSEWFQPHVANLEHSLQMTKKSFNTVTMDIELISKLYQESLKNLENKRIYCEKIEEERNIMGEKLAEVIKKLRIEKRENVRKDALITKVMASRMASIDSVKEKEGKVSETYEKLHVSIVPMHTHRLLCPFMSG